MKLNSLRRFEGSGRKDQDRFPMVTVVDSARIEGGPSDAGGDPGCRRQRGRRTVTSAMGTYSQYMTTALLPKGLWRSRWRLNPPGS